MGAGRAGIPARTSARLTAGGSGTDMHLAHLLGDGRVHAAGTPAAPAREDQGLGVHVLAELRLENDAGRLAEDRQHLHVAGVERVVQALAIMVSLAVQRAAGGPPGPAPAGPAARLDR